MSASCSARTHAAKEMLSTVRCLEDSTPGVETGVRCTAAAEYDKNPQGKLRSGLEIHVFDIGATK
jgi:hypothetical protein